MLSKQTFALGMQFINSVLSKNSQINTNETLNSYYLLLSDLREDCFLIGVTNLMKDWKNPNFIPGPGELREYVEREMFGGLSKEEFVLIAQAFKHNPGKINISNTKILELINEVDFKNIDSGLIEFKK